MTQAVEPRESGLMLPFASQSRARISYFSESRYSSRPPTARSRTAPSRSRCRTTRHSVAASTARITNAGRPWSRWCGLMSGVFVNGLRPEVLAHLGDCVSSVRYSRSSRRLAPGEVRVALGEADFASSCIIFGFVNASERKITSGWSRWTSAISHAQNAIGFVCGLSTRKIRTPRSIQNLEDALHSLPQRSRPGRRRRNRSGRCPGTSWAGSRRT